MTGGGLFGDDLGEAQVELGKQAVLGELLVDVSLKVRASERGLRAGGKRLGLQHAALERDLEVDEFRFRGLELRFGVGGGLFDVGIGQHQDDAVGRDLCAGSQDNLVDATL